MGFLDDHHEISETDIDRRYTLLREMDIERGTNHCIAMLRVFVKPILFGNLKARRLCQGGQPIMVKISDLTTRNVARAQFNHVSSISALLCEIQYCLINGHHS